MAAIAGIIIGLMARFFSFLWGLILNVGDALLIFITRGIKGESLKVREFKKKEITAVVIGVVSLVILVAVICALM